jgi:hypothetical protein
MSNLSNLYISQSFFGVVNLENAELSLSSSVGDTQLQDGVGTNLGLIINSGSNTITLDRNVNVSDNLIVSGNAEFKGDVNVSGSFVHTGSIDVLGDITASGNIKATIGNFDTLNTRVLHVTEESASVIFSSGSNILGDEASDVQTLNGTVNIPNLEFLAGNVVDTDTRINNLNTFTSSQESINIGYNEFTASVTQSLTDVSASFDTTILNLSSSVSGGQYIQDQRLDSLETYTGSLDLQYVERAEYNVYTQSIIVEQTTQDGRLTNLELETGSIEAEQVVQNNQLSNIEQTTASLQTEIDGLSNATSSYARLDINNDFKANQIITGSVNGNVEQLTIASLTASIDCEVGNFFKVTLPAGVTQLEATNITPGQTISLRLTSVAGASMTHNNTIKYPLGLEYIPSLTGSYDLLTFVSFDNTELLGAGLNTFNI